jgi:hypothetical protein
MRLILTLLAAAVVAPVLADDAVTIKIKIDADVGKTVTFRSTDVSTGSMKFFQPPGKLLFEQKKEGSETSYRDTVLERDKDGKATRFVRVYDKASEQEDGKMKTFSYQGRTVLFEKKDGKFRLGVAGEPPLDAKDVEKLLKDVNKKGDANALLRHLPPKKSVKVGDSWSVPPLPVAESMDDMPIDPEKSSITAKLVKVYTKGKSQFATFEIALKMALTSKTEDGTEMTFDPGSTLTAQMKLDAAIDGSTTERKEGGTMALKGDGKMTAGAMKLKIVFDMSGTGGEEVSAEVNDPKARVVPKVTFAAASGEWTEFKQKEHGFTAKFPGKPQTKADTKNNITTTEYGVQIDNGRVFYGVTVSEYPPDKFKLDPKSAYGNLKKGPNIKESSDIKVAGHDGVELKQDVKKGATIQITQRVVIVGQRMYQLLVVVEEGRKADAKQFFESFQLDEKPPAKKRDD